MQGTAQTQKLGKNCTSILSQYDTDYTTNTLVFQVYTSFFNTVSRSFIKIFPNSSFFTLEGGFWIYSTI